MTKNVINLLDSRRDEYSTIGNDGIIEHILDIVNIKKGMFVEFGAWDGKWTSNCRKLFEEGWKGIFIECDGGKYGKLKKNYKLCREITCLHKKVGFNKESFDNIVRGYLKKKKIDFCSIDVDGLDVEIFETFEQYLPEVVCIESGFILPPYRKRVPSRISRRTIQQSLNVTIRAFEKKGYKIVCAGINCFFVKEKYYHLFNVPTDILTLYFNGLRAFPEYIPSIWNKLKKVDGLKKYKNEIALKILDKAEYRFHKDSAHTRRVWSGKKYDIILKAINEIEKEEKIKRDSF